MLTKKRDKSFGMEKNYELTKNWLLMDFYFFFAPPKAHKNIQIRVNEIEWNIVVAVKS